MTKLYLETCASAQAKFMQKLVIYNHGKDSIPWGEKAIALAEVAKRHDFMFISPDYQASNDPDLRVKQLLAIDLSAFQEIVLIGSSMGAYVATVASELIKPKGLFLIAPAFYLPGYQCTEFKPTAEAIGVFHGWQDDIVPPENSWRFCQKYRISLKLYDTDHRMLSVMPQITEEFSRFLGSFK